MVIIEELKSNIDALDLKMFDPTMSSLSGEINLLTKAGGKKFRPGLMFLMGKVFHLSPEALRPYARAVELTHLASLIHDDVIDDSDHRRNHPTLNATKDNTTAILAGDFVLATVMSELARLNNNELLIDLTQCIKDLADGEWLQYDLKSKKEVKAKDLELIALKKTGSLIRYCCTTPAKLSHYHDLSSMEVMGEKIGLMFQMADDIVDGIPQSGRAPHQDITNGQFNYVTLSLIQLFPELKEHVYALKDKTSPTLPWSEAQYHQAVLKVHAEINQEKMRLLEIFKSLCQEKNQQELVDLFELTLEKIQLNYTSQIQL